jgi:membrane protein DedA with SNARE-associated domain
MNETIEFLARHGYWLLIGAVLGRQACLPIPTALILVAAGALSRDGRLSLVGTVAVSVVTFLVADLAWYEAGRRFGDRVLHFLCGLSRDPGSCVRRATSAFAIHGGRTLLISKFVIGLDAVAVPLVGAARISLARFLVFDAFGAIFWSLTYAELGYTFSDQLNRVAAHVIGMGTFVVLAVAAGLGFYIVRKFARGQWFVRQFTPARITPE